MAPRKTKEYARSTAVATRKRPYMGEIAVRADDIFARWQPDQYNPDILQARKGGLSLYKSMKEDDQIKAALRLKKSATTTSGWEIEGDNEEHVEFVEYCFEQMDGSVEEMITSMLSAFEYGFSLHEKVYKYFDVGEYSGKVGLRSVRSKSPTRITFDLDENGNLKPLGILQRLDTGVKKALPIDKFVLYTYQKEFDNYYGESDLKAAYRPYFVKTNVFRYWAIYLEKFSIPIAKGQTRSGRITDTQKDAFKTLMQNIQAGMSVLLPQDMSLDLLESARVDRGMFNQAVDACNIAIARAILIPQLIGLVPQQGVGSYGKSETDMKMFDWILKDINSNTENVINNQIIKDLIIINYGAQEEYPEFRIKPLKEDDKAKMVASWSEAVARGAATSTVETEEYVRDLLNFPELTEEEKSHIEEIMTLMVKPPAKGSSGLAGGNPSGGSKMANAPGMQNQYSRMDGPASRVAWEEYVKALDGIEAETKKELTDAFEASIIGLIKDAKKNSRIQSG